MKIEQSFVESCKKMDFTFAKAAQIELKLFLWLDYSVFESIKEKEGVQKAFDIHMKIWRSWVPDILEEYKREYNTNEIESNLASLIQIIKYFFDTNGCLMKITKANDNEFVGIIDRCPFVENAEKEYGITQENDYCKSLELIVNSILKKLIDEIVDPNKFQLEISKSICKGDKYCKIEVSKLI